MTRHGATPEEWAHFSAVLGLTQDLLPSIANPAAPISPLSKLTSLGKVPSIYNAARQGHGIPRWPAHTAHHDDIMHWQKEPDYAICLINNTVRAIDLDLTDANAIINALVTVGAITGPLPCRSRDNSTKCLLLFALPGEYRKRIIKTEHGLIEFLATGNQCLVAGTHPSGARYQWRGGLPDTIPALSPELFERLWDALHTRFAVEPERRAPREHKAPQSVPPTGATKNDPISKSLVTQGLVRATGGNGRLFIECPFAAGHTADTGPGQTAYLPAGTRGHEAGHFHCLHASCSERTLADYITALNLEPDYSYLFEGIEPAGALPLEPAAAARFVFSSWAAPRDPPRWLIKGVLPAAALGVVYGESKAGKTFLVLDMACAVARGESWQGHRVAQGAVAYIAAEDADGVYHRLKAYAAERGVSPDMPVSVLPAAPNFTSGKGDLKALVDALRVLGPVALVVVDTLARVTPGADENSAADMGQAIAFCSHLHQATGALVLLIHHSGKDASKGARGSSALSGAADAMLEVSRVHDTRFATIIKMKNGADGEVFGFGLRPVVVGVDEDGDDITSCVVEVTEAPAKIVAGRGKGAFERAITDVLRDMAAFGPAGGSVTHDTSEVIASVLERVGHGRRYHVRRALEGMIERQELTGSAAEGGAFSVVGNLATC